MHADCMRKGPPGKRRDWCRGGGAAAAASPTAAAVRNRAEQASLCSCISVSNCSCNHSVITSSSVCRHGGRPLAPTAALLAAHGSGFGTTAGRQQQRQHTRRQLGHRVVVRAERDFYQILGVSRDAGALVDSDS